MVSVGDSIFEDDPILVMTDKATVEIPSPVNGVVSMIIGDPGDILDVGEVCIEFEVDVDGNASAILETTQDEIDEIIEEIRIKKEKYKNSKNRK